MTTAALMKDTIDHLLALPENKDGASLQLVTPVGVLAGAVRWSPVPGVLNLRHVAEQKGTNKKIMIDILLPITEVSQVHRAAPEGLVEAVGGLVDAGGRPVS